ncbi:MAG: hypothetical protein ABJG78_12450 [Cyclobacteriaceae bacterium]
MLDLLTEIWNWLGVIYVTLIVIALVFVALWGVAHVLFKGSAKSKNYLIIILILVILIIAGLGDKLYAGLSLVVGLFFISYILKDPVVKTHQLAKGQLDRKSYWSFLSTYLLKAGFCAALISLWYYLSF